MGQSKSKTDKGVLVKGSVADVGDGNLTQPNSGISLNPSQFTHTLCVPPNTENVNRIQNCSKENHRTAPAASFVEKSGLLSM